MQMKETLGDIEIVDRYYRRRTKLPDDRVVNELSLAKKVALCGVALFSILLTVFVFAPAVWFNMFLQEQSGGRLILNDAEGTLWNGSAEVVVALNKNKEMTPLLPGRFKWDLSPILLLGQIELVIENDDALAQPLYITGNLRHIQINPNELLLPANRLVGLGAPLNTIEPSGQMTLSWNALGLTLLDRSVDINGTMNLVLENVASALSPVKPLGSYLMSFDWHGNVANVDLKTLHGPMLLTGKGTITNGRLRFSGLAQAEAAQEDSLANLLNLLGQHRAGAKKNVISLEFK